MIALGILLALGLMVAVYLYFNTDIVIRPKDEPPTATDVLMDNLKDPLVTSRAFFTEPETGPIGDFVGYSPVSQDDWLHSLPHEET